MWIRGVGGGFPAVGDLIRAYGCIIDITYYDTVTEYFYVAGAVDGIAALLGLGIA